MCMLNCEQACPSDRGRVDPRRPGHGMCAHHDRNRGADDRTWTAAHDVANTADIAAGQGTVGGFIKDPTFYENLTALLEGARRSWILRTVIQSTVNKGQEGER